MGDGVGFADPRAAVNVVNDPHCGHRGGLGGPRDAWQRLHKPSLKVVSTFPLIRGALEPTLPEMRPISTGAWFASNRLDLKMQRVIDI